MTAARDEMFTKTYRFSVPTRLLRVGLDRRLTRLLTTAMRQKKRLEEAAVDQQRAEIEKEVRRWGLQEGDSQRSGFEGSSEEGSVGSRKGYVKRKG